jgi:hypothetical protein
VEIDGSMPANQLIRIGVTQLNEKVTLEAVLLHLEAAGA